MLTRLSPGSEVGTDAEQPLRRIVVLGSTGSIGRQTLDIVRLHPQRFGVAALVAGSNAELLIEQAIEFRPEQVVIGDESKYSTVAEELKPRGIEVFTGSEGARLVAGTDTADLVVAAMVGFAGLDPVLAALEKGATVALANKEALVVAGALVSETMERAGGHIIPVDSEHSAILQCLVGEDPDDIEEIILTASGGPFRDRPIATFNTITAEEALDHPNWSMGPKITIDSATMMNKGLEVIEARWLFGLKAERISVVIHPQSIVHSMVTFVDGSVKAQLGIPDMRIPIQYALSYPTRIDAPHTRIDWTSLRRLDFETPDRDKFACLGLAYDALRSGGTAPATLNAANEAAVDLFLRGAIQFLDIPRSIEAALAGVSQSASPGLDDLIEVDREARALVAELKKAPRN